MKKYVYPLIYIFVVLSFFMFTSDCSYASEVKDRDSDDIITFKDIPLSIEMQMKEGYSAGLRGQDYGYEMIYVMNNPVVRDVHITSARKNSRSNSAYMHQAARTRSYYNRIKDDREKYPRDTNRWFVVKSWKEGDEYVAIVNCTARVASLTTPETIRYDHQDYKVIGIDLANTRVEELTITDNITWIKRCQCPNLKTLKGGLYVETIGNQAFMDCMYFTNMPYFPRLKTIGNFAFEGCYFLTEVLLPPGIESMSYNSFGWYDVIKGNFDYETEAAEDISLGVDLYADKYKIFGITLYAAEGSKTHDTISEIYKPEDRKCFVSVALKDKYPGTQGPVEIEDEEYLEWIPPEDPSNYEWGEGSVNEPTTPTQISNSISTEKKEILKWLEDLLLNGDIDADMMVTLVNAMSGYTDIPREFLDKYAREPQCVLLVQCYAKFAQFYTEGARLREQKRIAEAAALDEKRFKERNYAMNWLMNEYSIIADTLKKDGVPLNGNIANGLAVFASVNDIFTYVKDGATWQSAFTKAGATASYSLLVGMTAPSPLGIYETVLFVTFGNSKAGDSLSVVGTGKHFVEFMVDLYYNAFYDAWSNSSQFADNVKWRAFYTLFRNNLKQVFKDLTDTRSAKYGQNLTNLACTLEMLLNPEDFIYIFNGLIEDFNKGKIYSNFSQTIYDVTVKDNALGELIFDYVASFYEESPDILTEYTKYYSSSGR